MPDEWSDHDFFLIVEPGAQEEFGARLSWLADGAARPSRVRARLPEYLERAIAAAARWLPETELSSSPE